MAPNVNTALSQAKNGWQEKQEAAGKLSGGLFSLRNEVWLSSARDFRSLCVDPTAIQSIIDNLSYGGNVGVNVHAITRCQVSNNALGSNFHWRT
jgi:hypothetical protein